MARERSRPTLTSDESTSPRRYCLYAVVSDLELVGLVVGMAGVVGLVGVGVVGLVVDS